MMWYKWYKESLFTLIFFVGTVSSSSPIDNLAKLVQNKPNEEAFNQNDLQVVQKVADMNWNKPEDFKTLCNGGFATLIDLIISPYFYQRVGAKEALKMLFQGPVFAGENVIYVPGALDKLLALFLGMLTASNNVQDNQPYIELLKLIDLSYIGRRGIKKEGTILLRFKPDFKPMEQLVEVAQAKDSKDLFDSARAYFKLWGDDGEYASKIVGQMGGPGRQLGKHAIEFARDLVRDYLSIDVVEEGKLKDAIKNKDVSFFTWTVEKAMTELEGLLGQNPKQWDMELIKKKALKVTRFTRESIDKSKEKESLNTRTLKVIAELLEAEKQETPEIVDILLESQTLTDVNEKVMVNGTLKQLLPLYITHVVQKTDTEGALLYLIDTRKADFTVPVDVQGKQVPIYIYLAQGMAKKPDLFNNALGAAFRRVSPLGVQQYGSKESGFVLQPAVANAMFKTIVTEVNKEQPPVIKTTIKERLTRMIGAGADQRLLPAGPLRKAVQEECKKNPGKYEKLEEDKVLSIGDTPTHKASVKETVEAIKKSVENNDLATARELAEDLPFFGQEAEPEKEIKLQGESVNAVNELLSLPQAAQIISDSSQLVKKLIENGVLPDTAYKSFISLKKADDMPKEEALIGLARSLKALNK